MEQVGPPEYLGSLGIPLRRVIPENRLDRHSVAEEWKPPEVFGGHKAGPGQKVESGECLGLSSESLVPTRSIRGRHWIRLGAWLIYTTSHLASATVISKR